MKNLKLMTIAFLLFSLSPIKDIFGVYYVCINGYKNCNREHALDNIFNGRAANREVYWYTDSGQILFGGSRCPSTTAWKYNAIAEENKLRNELRAQEEARRRRAEQLAREEAEREAQRRAERERAEQLARLKAAKEAQERAERERAEQLARLKAAKEAQERAERDAQNTEEKNREQQERERKIDEYKQAQKEFEGSIESSLVQEAIQLAIDACFISGTIVKTPTGDRPIEDIRPGDTVYSCNLETRECFENKVVENIELKKNLLIKLITKKGEIISTDDHPFYVIDEKDQGRFLHASELKEGDQLLKIKNGKKLKILKTEVIELEEPISVYNIGVEGGDTSQNYYVSSGVLVHNCKLKGKIINAVDVASEHVKDFASDPRIQTGLMITALTGAAVSSGGGAIPAIAGGGVAIVTPELVTAMGALLAGTVALSKMHSDKQNANGNSGEKQSSVDKNLKYTNPGHHDPTKLGANGYNRTKSVIPKNHEELWHKSVPDPLNSKARWTKVGEGKKAEYHRFQSSNDGTWHWNGSTNGVTSSGESRALSINDVPILIRRQ